MSKPFNYLKCLLIATNEKYVNCSKKLLLFYVGSGMYRRVIQNKSLKNYKSSEYIFLFGFQI